MSKKSALKNWLHLKEKNFHHLNHYARIKINLTAFPKNEMGENVVLVDAENWLIGKQSNIKKLLVHGKIFTIKPLINL